MKRFLASALVAVLAFLCAAPCFAADGSQIASQSAYLINLETGSAVYGKNENQKITMGTLSKIMVALLTVENVDDLSAAVTVSDVAYNNAINKGNGGPNAYLKKGEVLSVDDLLTILMVRSGLDASNALAEYVAGSLTSFVVKMNERAAEIGCENTNFVNASGAENPSQYTCARDMALILQTALKNERFLKYAYLTTAYVANSGYDVHSFKTSNALVKSDSEDYYYSAAKGVAYTQLNDSTNSIATLLTKGGSQYVCVVMGGGVNGNNLKECFLDAKAIGEWVFSAFKTVSLAEKGSIICDTPIELCEQTDRLNLLAANDVSATVAAGADLSAITTKVEYYHYDTLYAPVEKGEAIGKVMYLDADGNLIAECELVSALSLERSEKLEKEMARREFMRSPAFIIIVVAAVLVLAAIASVAYILYRRNRVDGFRR